MHGRCLSVAAALAAAVLAVAQPVVGATPPHRHAVHRSRPVHPKPRRRPVAGQPQIACTVVGCVTIPEACRPVAGRTPGGIPTGFDVIVCPTGTWPLK